MNNPSYWFNYDKDEYELRGTPRTDAEAIELLPKSPTPAARHLYKLYRDMGEDILDAMIKVLEACTGISEAEDED